MLLPLRDLPEGAPRNPLPAVVEELKMQCNIDGADSSDCRCQNMYTPPLPKTVTFLLCLCAHFCS